MCNMYAESTCFMARPKSFPKGRMCACVNSTNVKRWPIPLSNLASCLITVCFLM